MNEPPGRNSDAVCTPRESMHDRGIVLGETDKGANDLPEVREQLSIPEDRQSWLVSNTCLSTPGSPVAQWMIHRSSEGCHDPMMVMILTVRGTSEAHPRYMCSAQSSAAR